MKHNVLFIVRPVYSNTDNQEFCDKMCTWLTNPMIQRFT